MKYRFTASFVVPGLLRLFRTRAVAATVAWGLLLAFVPLVSGCHSYFRSKDQDVSRENVNLLAEKKTFVLHQGDAVWVLRDPKLNGETLEGTKEPLPASISAYQSAPKQGVSPRYRSEDAAQVLNIVHVYINDFQPGAGDAVSIPLAAIKQIDLIEKNTGKTTASYVLTGVAVTVGVIALLLVIIALTKSSCPFVYAYDGHQFRFVGEAYGGAIFAPAERNDYLPLPGLQAVDNQYQVIISNELEERQYTNLAELWVAQHPAGTQVLLDQRGHVQTLTAPLPPTRARTPGGTDCTAQLQATDRRVYPFNEDTASNAPNSLELTFDKPAAARHGKLVLHAQNSLWLDYLYGEFINKFGAYYNTWADQQRTLPAEINRQWGLDQSIPLKVYVEEGKGWRLVETIPTVGPLAARDLVVPIDFAAGAATQVRVKLECGFMFWEVDYAALDCGPNAPVQLDNCRLLSARTERGAEVRTQLAADDGEYLRQLRPGTAATLAYETRLPAPAAGTRRTAFLRTKGYYEHIREFEGLPDLPELYAFKKPGRFVEFSKERYRKATQDITTPVLARR
ncbi:MAG: hypothetical protein JWR44_3815 [Hymenobacter sp.]|nr:hypothetical protein [Hymenobacter sp.]